MTRPPRVVVTGVGAVTPAGSGPHELWKNLLEGRCAFSPVRSFDTSRHSVHVGAEIRGFDPAPSFRVLAPDSVGRTSQLAVAAARQALGDAGVDPAELAPECSGVVMGTTSGEAAEIEAVDDRLRAGRDEPFGPDFLQRYPSHLVAVHVAAELGLAGGALTLAGACAAGNVAIAHASDLLRSGRAVLMLAGGADCFSRVSFTGFARLGAVAPDVCRPFDRDRQGMIPGEGAAVLALETLEGARARGARVYAEVAGCGLTCDAHHMTAGPPDGEGAARAMERALRESGLDVGSVDYISAHGTGTPTNDRVEARAIARVFGDAAQRIPTSSIKSMIGHTMGAASAIEAVVCCLAIRDGRVPPTMNFREPDPECPLDCVPNAARELPVRVAMNNAYAFGGNNASVILRECAP